MNLHPDDPKLTAYALGELSAEERREIEAWLETSPEGRRAVEEIRETSAALASELHAEAAPPLADPQRRSIERAARNHGPVVRSWRLLALAASIVVLGSAGLAYMALRTRESAESIAYRDVPASALTDPLGHPSARGKDGFFRFSDSVDSESVICGARMTGGKLAALGYFSESGKGRGVLGGNALGWKGKTASAEDLDFVVEEINGKTDERPGTESYARFEENPFVEVVRSPLSTFSIDVDTASYANVRRFLGQGQLPPKDAVRLEELINYFAYDYPPPSGDAPFSIDVEVAACPWNAEHRLARVGLRGREIPAEARPASNLVFLIDVSGSMEEPNKLPLVKRSLRLLVDQLDGRDRVALAVYAGNSGLVLEPTSCADKAAISEAIERLEAGGSTNGGAGIQLAYDVATKGKIAGGINRVILATDGDFNVGIASEGELERLIESEAKTGVFLTVLGFGMGNTKDSTLEKLADHGNGHYAYVDSLDEARKVLVEEFGATLQTIAKDVKIQVEWNPATTAGYRLIGYEKRALRAEDFNDDAKDAGEIGAGHRVTALYEVVPAGRAVPAPPVDALRYQQTPSAGASTGSGDLFTVKLRYKDPEGDASKLLEQPIVDAGAALDGASVDLRFAAAVAEFGMLLRGSPYLGSTTWDGMRDLAAGATGPDANGRRAEFLGLVGKARAIVDTMPGTTPK